MVHEVDMTSQEKAEVQRKLISRCELIIEGTRFNQLVWKRIAQNEIRTQMMFEHNANGTSPPDIVELRRIPGDWPTLNMPKTYDFRIYASPGILNSRDYQPLQEFGKYMFGD